MGDGTEFLDEADDQPAAAPDVSQQVSSISGISKERSVPTANPNALSDDEDPGLAVG